MSQEHQQTGSGKTGADSSKPIFRAYTEQRRSSYFRLRYVLYPAALLLLGGLGAWTVSFHQEATPIRVETTWGLRTVRKGMSPQDVQSLLGQPTSKERRGNQECYQYGRPSIQVPTFILHVVCYEDGKLREVSERRYNSWVVTQDMAISPAPLEEELVLPASTSEPGLAGRNPP